MKKDELLSGLEDLGVKGIIGKLVEQGQVLELACEMPKCYCPKGRTHFDSRSAKSNDWCLNADHYPTLKKEGGHLTAGNVRLAHVLCNREDYSWRNRITPLLDKGWSLAAIADDLNKKGIRPPHGSGRWTPALVRRAFVS